MRREGKKIGLIKLRLYRPFPIQEIKEALSGVRAVAVVDRAISAGGLGGPIYGDLRNIMYDERDRPAILSFIAGLGGRDITIKDFITIGERALEAVSKEQIEYKVEFIQARM
jgi:pyruvate ferredoxin oxidoreductase alpha subunit